MSGVLRLDQLSIGEKVVATVKQFCRAGLVVALGPSLTGLIPTLYLSDVALSKPELKFIPGDKVLLILVLILILIEGNPNNP